MNSNNNNDHHHHHHHHNNNNNNNCNNNNCNNNPAPTIAIGENDPRLLDCLLAQETVVLRLRALPPPFALRHPLPFLGDRQPLQLLFVLKQQHRRQQQPSVAAQQRWQSLKGKGGIS